MRVVFGAMPCLQMKTSTDETQDRDRTRQKVSSQLMSAPQCNYSYENKITDYAIDRIFKSPFHGSPTAPILSRLI